MSLNERFEPLSQFEGEEAECEEASSKAVEEEYIPVGKYDGALYAVYKNNAASRTLKAVSAVSVFLCVAIFVAAMVFYGISDWKIPVKLAVVSGVPFILVTVFRKLLNFPRPYEVLTFYRQAPRRKRGQSFPSRHVFSIFVIGTSLCFLNLPLGVSLMITGLALAASRVLLGIHFIRDVLAGALIGIVSGAVGMLIANAVF